MPIITINVWKEHMNKEIKKQLIQRVTKEVSEILNAPPFAVEIIINEVPKENWGKAGMPSDEWKPDQFKQ